MKKWVSWTQEKCTRKAKLPQQWPDFKTVERTYPKDNLKMIIEVK